MPYAKKTQPSANLQRSDSVDSPERLRVYVPPVDLEGADDVHGTVPDDFMAEAMVNPDAGSVQASVGQRNPEEKPLAFCSPIMGDLIEKAKRYARSSAPILITGESGTGKEMFSRLIHRESARANQKFVAVNCAAMPELLVESELFGHDRGAFTGAFQQRLGHFQQAHRGTLLLDEISEIATTIQSKLLRVIEEQEVLRVGRSTPEKVDVRILATSNRDLHESVQAGCFRLDLFYRVNVLQIRIPPLRERRADIPVLASHFLDRLHAESGGPTRKLTRAAIQRLCEYEWPGNVRELRNVIHCAWIESDQDCIDVDGLPIPQSLPTNAAALPSSLSGVEREMILACLRKHQGRKSAAALELGITARTLANKLRLYRLEPA